MYSPFFQCSANECGAYLQYKKQGKDSGMPKALAERRLHCREWMSRPSPPPSPTHSEDEGGEQDASVDVAAALLGLALNSIWFNDDVDDDEGAHYTWEDTVWAGDLMGQNKNKSGVLLENTLGSYL